MEGQPPEPPLKVCPHCSVATRTEADTCPSCGKPYGRGRPQLRWSWWFAIPIVVAAFLIGYFGISQLFDDEEPAGITVEQAEAVPEDVTRSELAGHLDDQAPARVAKLPGAKGVTCDQYLVTDQPRTVWQFCFKGDALQSAGPVGSTSGPAAPGN